MPPDFLQQHPDFYNWVLFPILIFMSRMADVSLGTLRAVLAAKGNKKIVPFIGFFEVLLWLFAISQIMQNLNNVMCYLAWAGGYAMGSFIGLTIEERLAIGVQIMRIITNQNPDKLTAALTENQFGYTTFNGEGARGPVKMIFTIVKRKEVPKVAALIKEYNPEAFFSVADAKAATGVSYKQEQSSQMKFFSMLMPVRKGK